MTRISGCIAAAIVLAASLIGGGSARAQGANLGPAPVASAEEQWRFGPYDVEFPAGGDGLLKPLPGRTAAQPLAADGSWTLQAWIEVDQYAGLSAPIAGLGLSTADSLYIWLDEGRPAVWSGGQVVVRSNTQLGIGRWRHVAAVSDGAATRLYVDGREAGRGPAATLPTASTVALAPRGVSGAFAGRVAGFTASGRASPPSEIRVLAASAPNPALVNFETGSPSWPVQLRQQAGQMAPQDPWTRPKSAAPVSAPTIKPVPVVDALAARGGDVWDVNGWRLAEAPLVRADGSALSRPDFDASRWRQATVPGTVLTTLVDRGEYPDPVFGLNNLAIPESLSRHDWWYRTSFPAPADLAGKRLMLTFKGVNYAAEVWLNGERIGDMRGAFVRGQFEVTDKLKPGQENALAVRVSPPPHPGLPHEESLTSGVGENGGMMPLDGPTFMASEGWDWIPTVRDRNTGLWQGVELKATGPVRIGDTRIVTTLPKADNSIAEVEIAVPVQNLAAEPLSVEVRAAFDDVSIVKTAVAPPGESTVLFSPREFAQLSIQNPRLWWPNGYGEPTLHALQINAAVDGVASDVRNERFGIREVTYELSLMDQTGRLRRAELDLAQARARGEHITDVSHEAIRRVPNGWAISFRPGAEQSSAVRMMEEDGLQPHLVIRVNGVRIAAKGGNWGTDDWRKQVSRDKLEPYFRLHRDAHLNIIRNWVGQNTEDVFFELADEYGLMILNDFWASTQNFQLEPQDVPLFLENAADVVRRYRNHPSIVLWFGRNEGVPQPILNEALEDLVWRLDGTRHYTGSSNVVNLAGSGPYNYREPETYFTEHARGFSVEVGTPSFPTLESFRRAIAPEDQWPISDAWAYHDWHQSGNGDVTTFMRAMETSFGAATSLEDFERKAQMMNYVTHRAMFEGMNAHLWTANSGRLLWMTQPAWPSTMWQILSSDYDTHASFYGVKKASEPVHVQLDLPDHRVKLINNTVQPLGAVRVRAQVFDLSGRPLGQREAAVEGRPIAVSEAFKLDLSSAFAQGVALVRLGAFDADDKLLSENFYWLGKDAAALQALNGMPSTTVTLSAVRTRSGGEDVINVRLENTGAAPALAAKLGLFRADGVQILPAYFSDNYVSLLPGEAREVRIAAPSVEATGPLRVTLRGWNVEAAGVDLSAQP